MLCVTQGDLIPERKAAAGPVVVSYHWGNIGNSTETRQGWFLEMDHHPDACEGAQTHILVSPTHGTP